MLGQQFYHETMRNVIVAFGTLFNNIHLVRKNNSGSIIQTMKVPLAYGPKQKWLRRLDQDPSLDSKVAITLPRLGFEIQNLSYDTSRKLNRVQRFRKVKSSSDNSGKLDSQYMPVPYNLDVELYVMAKQSDDALQIVEQILPFFQPDYTLTIKDMTEMGIKRDVPIVLNSVAYEDNYQGEFTERRAIIYTLSFTTKFYLYGPITSQNIIKTVQVDQYTDLPDAAPKREQRYTVTPSPATSDADDDFGFNETTSFFEDAKDFNPKTGNDDPDNSTSGVGT
ncbi:MAG: hypothetical protein CBD62_00515 [Candidatus Pelagibacter sp. TMED202]|nr:MAG: hypothetical protein CBD62_00515 [Candidatus Pelagibacter sp. TMED202]|tara:strand:+ start:2023 stop:2859 length:837 start_codon:yes stop_codon:yes gene_type:complete